MNRLLTFTIITAGVVVLALILASSQLTSAFIGPGSSNTPPPAGSGAIGVDANQNLSVGTSTPDAATKFLIIQGASNTYGLRVVQPGGVNPALYVRSGRVGVATGTNPLPAELTVEGDLYVSGNITGATITGGQTNGAVSAANVTPDVFNRLQGGSGNYAFPGNLGIATTTTVNLPQALSVYGGGYFSGNVGVGITNPDVPLVVNGEAKIYATGLANPPTLRVKDLGVSIGYLNQPKFGLDVNLAPTGRKTARFKNEWGEFPIIFSNFDASSSIGFNIKAEDGYRYDINGVGGLLSFDGGDFLFQTAPAGTADTIAPLTTRMRILNNGNVGIGTTTPAYTLDVNGALRLEPQSGPDPTGANGVMFYDADTNKFRCFEAGAWKDCDVATQLIGGSAYYIPIWLNSTQQGISVIAQNSTSATANVGVGTINPTSARLVVRGVGTTSTSTALDVQNSAGTSLLYVRNDGNVGVGITNPDVPLVVNGEAKIYAAGLANPPRLKVESLAVGIGLNSPGYGLDVNLAPNGRKTARFRNQWGAFPIIFSNFDASSSIGFNIKEDAGFKYDINGVGGLLLFAGGDFIFQTAPTGTADTIAPLTTRMRILNNGQVVIGGTTPSGAVLTVDAGSGAQALTLTRSAGSRVTLTLDGPDNFELESQGGGSGVDRGLIIKRAEGGPDSEGIFITGAAGYQGFVGIGSLQPRSRLTVSEGDIYVSSSSRGIILKAPDGHCARGTLENTNTLLWTTIPCP